MDYRLKHADHGYHTVYTKKESDEHVKQGWKAITVDDIKKDIADKMKAHMTAMLKQAEAEAKALEKKKKAEAAEMRKLLAEMEKEEKEKAK